MNRRTCPTCKRFAAKHSVSRLYVDHVNAIANVVRRNKARPAIWADMVLHHREALDRLGRDIRLFDWMYDIHHGNSWIFAWGKGFLTFSTIDFEMLDTFGRHLFPDGYESGRIPYPFYTADYLREKGFQVTTCPASSHAGDNVFAPRNHLHLRNTRDSFEKGAQRGFDGSVLTSWSRLAALSSTINTRLSRRSGDTRCRYSGRVREAAGARIVK